ncbi:hypothetical protein K6119_05125 [Paracrocinitomix mangrovi]|uniref:hypothetical protein n=1 Tax=Paracrocinitomix mangrovi TaxID=2862509 RepID=UPI001C8E5034|nr:hypothetical protein [Paracrocinitomix mangrovi]UKN02895.1 hypothetical protein K6119_05125 [Paracrocinitomix mangrovi]
MRIFIAALSILFITSTSIGQVGLDSTRVNDLKKFEFGGLYRSTVSFNLGGVTGWGGLTYDVLLSNNVGFEVGGGYLGGGFGFDFYPWRVERGKTRLKINLRNFVAKSDTPDWVMKHSLGIGFARFTHYRFNWAVDAGLAYPHLLNSFSYYDPPGGRNVFPVINFKLGFRFSYRVWKYNKDNL